MREEDESDEPSLTHTDTGGEAQLVDVTSKPEVRRRAVARGQISLQSTTSAAIRQDGVGKGDVLATARIGAIQAVKHTWESIPLCHQLPIGNVDVAFDLADDHLAIEVAVETTASTGCEMEALQGVTTGLNVVWDMVKAAEKDDSGQYPETVIEEVRVVSKQKQDPDSGG